MLPRIVRELEKSCNDRKGTAETVLLILVLVGGLVLIGSIAGLPGWLSFVIVMAGLFGLLTVEMKL